MTIEFTDFDAHGPIPEASIAAFEAAAPAGAAEMWRSFGTGSIGDDGFARIVDPQRAVEMLDGALPLPDGAVPMFTTGMADVIAWVNGAFVFYKLRGGTIHVVPENVDLEGLTRLLQDDAVLDALFERAPYREAAGRDGIPQHEDCYGYVPLLALGGSPESSNLKLMGAYEHMAIIAQIAGAPEVVGYLYDPA